MVEELTVEELKTMLETDTTNVKALIFYSQTCHSCKEMFSTYFKEAIDSCSNGVKFYIVSQDTNFTTPPEQYLLQLGYSGKSYYISALPKECSDNGFFRIDNIIKYLFPEHYADIESAVGLPFTLILSRDNDTAYGNNALRLSVATSIMKEYILNYNYNVDFEGGLDIVKRATEKYGLDPVFADEFMKRKSTVPGSPFPAGVNLVDADGKAVDFGKFKGKYVYVDMWASWCGPCCKEVPHLKKLEQELNNKDVVFVSISSDKDEQAWHNKMAELKMHGNQLLDRDNTLGEALNVKGIPFFVIYDTLEKEMASPPPVFLPGKFHGQQSLAD